MREAVAVARMLIPPLRTARCEQCNKTSICCMIILKRAFYGKKGEKTRGKNSMSTFAELYTPLLKDVIAQKTREQWKREPTGWHTPVNTRKRASPNLCSPTCYRSRRPMR